MVVGDCYCFGGHLHGRCRGYDGYDGCCLCSKDVGNDAMKVVERDSVEVVVVVVVVEGMCRQWRECYAL